MSAIREKLQKLISHEKSARGIGSQAEAEAFASKIQVLLFANNLSMSDVEIEEQERSEPIELQHVRDTVVGRISHRVEWLEDLAHAVAHATFCEHLIVVGSSTQTFIGRESDRVACCEMFRHLAAAAVGICASECAAWKSNASPRPWHEPADKAARTRRWKQSFLLGFAASVGQRLRTDREELKAAVEHSTGFALVQQKERAVKVFVDSMSLGKPARAIGGNELDWRAYESGKRRGEDISLAARAAIETGGAR